MSTKKKSMLWAVFAVASVAIVAPWNVVVEGDAHGADTGRVCDPRGTWFGTGTEAGFTALVTITGGSASRGVLVAELLDFDPTLGIPAQPFVSAVTMSDLRGSWVRTGGNTYKYTWLAHATDASGGTVYIMKNMGTWLLPDCNTLQSDERVSMYSSGTNPLVDEAMQGLACIPTGGGTFIRLPAEESCE